VKLSKPLTMVSAYINACARETIAAAERTVAKASSLKNYASHENQSVVFENKVTEGREIDSNVKPTVKRLTPKQVNDQERKGCVLNVMKISYLGINSVLENS